MAKTKISEFSATPANNTDIDNINIAEGCAPSGINDAIRELMAQLKDFQAGTAGDSFNGPIGTTTAAAGAFTTLTASSTATLNTLASSGATLTGGTINGMAIGATTASTGAFTTLAASGAVTLSGGTANGVAYLNGSKVLTTGSALTFDGTTFQTNKIYAPLAISIRSSTFPTNVNLHVSQDDSTAAIAKFTNTTTGVTATDGFDVGINASEQAYIWNNENTAMLFGVNNTEAMRLTSTGLGIGTSSPAANLAIGPDNTNNGQAGYRTLLISDTSNGSQIVMRGLGPKLVYDITGTNDAEVYYDNRSYVIYSGVPNATPTERMRLDSSGNLLVGVTTANANGGVLQLKSGITFPATAVAATDANTLDDYEEGTWTPNQGGGLTVVGTFSSTGNYVKIGKLVTVQVSLSATTSIAIASSDSVMFSNLPFGSSPTRNPGVAVNIGHSAGIFTNIASTTCYSCGSLAATTTIYFTFTYQTS